MRLPVQQANSSGIGDFHCLNIFPSLPCPPAPRLQAREALSAEANIHVLKELLEDASKLQVALELEETVRQRIHDSADWGKRAMDAVDRPTSLAQLNTLLLQV